MVDQPLLSDLCSICNNNPPKYCCPRCSTRTCSLPCYKRHQQWAQCSGQRDPAAYLKKSDLATPAAINHDYKFLTGIERAFDKADRHAEEKGISIRHGESREPAPGSNYHKYLQDMRVLVERAPKGMSRQKANATKWHKNEKCINWTVEWIHEDQSRDLAQVPDSKSLFKAYGDLVARKQGTSKKRKRGQNAVEPHARDSAVLPSDPPKPTDVRVRVGEPTEAIADHLDPAAQELHATDCGTNPDVVMHVSGPMFEAKGDTQQTSSKQTLGPDDSTVDGKPHAPESSTGEIDSHDRSSKEHYFYLVKPYTSTSRRVLIPVPPTSSLFECLKDQVVLEFPTIQVLSHPPSTLSDSFMLEQAYLDQSMKEEHELQDMLATVAHPVKPYSEDEEYVRRIKEEEAFHDRRILEVLQQDVKIKEEHDG